MKKSVLALALAFGVTTAFAQDLTSKKGEPILPEAGDWGVGINANPFLDYAGSFFGKSSPAAAPTWDFILNNSIISGKYFVDEKTAYRAGINLGFSSNKYANIVDQAGSTSNPKATVEDTKTHGTSGIGLTGGMEMRRGKTRLQGYYGGEVGIWFGGSHDKFTYGNPFSSSNPAVDWSQWTGGTASTTTSGGPRNTEVKNGSTFTFSLRGFIGAEYFFMAKMSLAAEFGWGLGFSSTGEGSTTSEMWDAVNNGVKTTTSKVGKSSAFSLGTDNKNSALGSSGQLRMNLYF